MTDRDTKPPAPAAPAEDTGFLRRWSQRKQAIARGEVPSEPVVAPAPSAVPVAPPDPRDELPLPDPASLTLADDFSAFLRPKVPAALKRQAMAQLFSHTHFNQVDGLDVYMDDYNLIPDMDDTDRSLLRHAKAVLDPAPQVPLSGKEADVGDEPAELDPPDIENDADQPTQTAAEASETAADGVADPDSAASEDDAA